MFFAKATENSNLTLYLKMLNNFVNEGKNEYEPLFKEVLVCSHQLAAEEITFYEIKPEIFEIVRHLNNNNKPYFKDIEIEKIDLDTYRNLINILRSSIPMPS